MRKKSAGVEYLNAQRLAYSLNAFVEYLTEELWDNKYPTKRGGAYTIINYMKLPKDQLEPIMTNSENIVQFGPNAYSKSSTSLNILRETFMGRKVLY